MTAFLAFYIGLCYYLIRRFINQLEEEEVKDKIGSLYEDYGTEGLKKWSILIFLSERFIGVGAIVVFNQYPYVQAGCFYAVNIISLLWTVFVCSNESNIMLSADIVSKLGSIVSNGVYVKLCDPTLTPDDAENLGTIVFFTFLIVCGFNILMGNVKSIKDFIEWCREKKEESKVPESYTSNVDEAVIKPTIYPSPFQTINDLPPAPHQVMVDNFMKQEPTKLLKK